MTRLVVFDIDDTLTRGISIWEMIYRLLGTWESVGARHLGRFVRGEIDYDEFARADAREFKGSPAGIVGAAAERLAYAPGTARVFRELRRRSIATALVSSSIGQFADWLSVRFDVPHVYANPLLVGPDGLLTGEIELAVPGNGKQRAMRALRRKIGVSREDVLAVGDSVLDLSMFEEAGRSCCVAHAPDAVKAAATWCLPDDSLLGVLELVGRRE